jgi:hypothetical protein
MIGIFAAAGSIKGLVRNGLFLSLDPSTGISGTTWTDDSNSGNSGTLNNTPSYSKYSGGYMWFNGSNNFYHIFSSSRLCLGICKDGKSRECRIS